ncbi:MAG: bifunctional 2-polyprenyl-6-hydroxyphenol methylase/3-demethylubiquinol 3-O-methyltransferase UbiG [Acidobacteriota bacterium]|nr:bifunctional 2-polyprenyl-6-hydroxyphenol methylase/3-demethylubiquinol 3-O-methyltransferase UbiG [Acidobacteriota bacterium]MDQ7088476.1 bifunctional 2-polyprenyl-6-hydroxyphenol methylase/3-demethylubiquinol 3-O-methyltransferase UbiG [Acidobacteriota bacterium]
MKRNRLDIYDVHGGEWWDERSRTFASLRTINIFRWRWLRRWLGDDLRDRLVVDLGCGGGLLAEPLARAGAHVVAVDLSPASLGTGRDHAAERRIGWTRADLHQAPLPDGCADHVLLADVLEHLEHPARAVREAARLLRAGGTLYVNTINRTLSARWLAVYLAEGVGLVPRGTHDPRLFVRPGELDRAAAACGLERSRRCGEFPRLLRTLWRREVHFRPARSLALAYSTLYVRSGSGPSGR